jgi:flagellar basal body-associated protein FliL
MVLLILVLAGLLAAGSAYGLLRPPGSGPLFRVGGTDAGNKTAVDASESGEAGVFTGIGRLRIPLAGGPSAPGGAATLILSIAFPYPPDDRAFTEELASKVGEFRTLTVDYFSSLPSEKLVDMDEDAAKADILGRYNAILRLGKIKALYFTDLVIVE